MPPHDPAAELNYMAKQRFGAESLTWAEYKLLESARTGQWRHCSHDEEKQRVIRNDVFRWLVFEAEPKALIHDAGIRLSNAVFEETLDLEHLRFDGGLLFYNCQFRSGIIIRASTLGFLMIAGAHAMIGKDADGRAFFGDGARVAGGLFLRHGVTIRGEVRLSTVNIDGVLDCTNATIENSDGQALSADRARVGGAVHLSKDSGLEGSADSRFEGEVNFVGATIRGDLDCSNALFENASGFAISAHRVRVGGTVHLSRDSRYEGEVSFAAATLNTVVLRASSFQEPSENGEDAEWAINFRSATIKRSIAFVTPNNCDEPANITGRVCLRNARIGQLIDSPEVWKSGKEGEVPVALDGCDYDSLGTHPKSYDVEFRRAWLASGERACEPASEPPPKYKWRFWRKESPVAFAPQPYTHLAKVMKASGHDWQANKMLVTRDILRRQRMRFRSYEWLGSITSQYLLGFGYRPWRTLFVLAAFWLIGFGVFRHGWLQKEFEPAVPFIYNSWVDRPCVDTSKPWPERQVQRFGPEGAELDEALPAYPTFHAIVYSLDTLVPLVNLHQENYWMPHGGTRVYMWIQISAGWVFTTLFVAGLTGIVRRD